METRYGTNLRLRAQSAEDRTWFTERDKATQTLLFTKKDPSRLGSLNLKSRDGKPLLYKIAYERIGNHSRNSGQRIKLPCLIHMTSNLIINLQ